MGKLGIVLPVMVSALIFVLFISVFTINDANAVAQDTDGV